jgi:NAD(P)-dependent dehydrogenase (short-subunit alcohol dehydrogenase family)
MPNALITGGAKRLGAALARRLISQGFRVAIHYNTSTQEAQDLKAELNRNGDMCEIFAGDIRDRATIDQVFQAAHHWLGTIDLCINNASLFIKDDIEDVDDALFNDHLAVNLKAPVYFAGLTAAQSGPNDCLIINMLDNKVFAINPDFLSYTLSKSALLTATQMLAMRYEGAPRVCGIAPAITLISGKQTPESFERSARINPLKRKIFPSDICDAAMLLWHTKSINNQVITIDGGQTLMQYTKDVPTLLKEGAIKP